MTRRCLVTANTNASTRNASTPASSHLTPTVGPVAQRTTVLEHQPGRPEKRIAQHQTDAAQDRERRQPHERRAGKPAVNDRQLLDHRADRRACTKPAIRAPRKNPQSHSQRMRSVR